MATVEQTWAQLRDAGLVSGELPAQGQEDTAWYVKALLGFSGWLAAVFLLGFMGLGIFEVLEEPLGRLVIGAGAIALAWWLLRLERNEFLEQAGLAISLAGQALIAWFLFEMADGQERVGAGLLAVFQIALAVFMPSFVHRVFSAFIAALSLSFIFYDSWLQALYPSALLLAVALVWLDEFRWPTSVRTVQAIGYGLVLALVGLKGGTFGLWSGGWSMAAKGGALAWLDELLNAAVLLYVIWRLLDARKQQANTSLAVAAFGGAALVCLASLQASGLVTGITIMLLGFAGGNRVLLGLGTLALLIYVSRYYYFLDTTLLVKSISLVAVGAVLLLVRAVLLKVLPAAEAPKNA